MLRYLYERKGYAQPVAEAIKNLIKTLVGGEPQPRTRQGLFIL